jgi:predicted nucleotidyltransferase
MTVAGPRDKQTGYEQVCNHATYLRERRADILRLAEKYGARNVRVFGSVARGEARPDSDIDLLVELSGWPEVV